MKALVNDLGQPVAHFEFDNGYTLSLLQRWGNDAPCNVSAAYWPTKSRSVDTTVAIGSELSDDECAKAFVTVSGLPPV